MATVRGLTDEQVHTIRDGLDAGRRPRVVFTSSAGQIAGQLGQVVSLLDPAESDEWVVVRFGRDELPFSPGDLQIAPRGAAARKATASATSAPAVPARAEPEFVIDKPPRESAAARRARSASDGSVGAPVQRVRSGTPAAPAGTAAADAVGSSGSLPRSRAEARRAAGEAARADGPTSASARPLAGDGPSVAPALAGEVPRSSGSASAASGDTAGPALVASAQAGRAAGSSGSVPGASAADDAGRSSRSRPGTRAKAGRAGDAALSPRPTRAAAGTAAADPVGAPRAARAGAVPTMAGSPRKAPRSVKGKTPASLTVTLAYTDGEWTVAAQQGAKTLARPYVVRPAEALRMVSLVDVPGVQEAVEQILSAERAVAEQQADRLRAELAEIEARLAELRDVG